MEKILLFYIIVINFVGFLIMYIDKSKAINNKWRIKEKTLMYIAIIGGSLGSLLGMHTFRHKTKHTKFTFGIPVIIASQLLLLSILGKIL